MHPFNDAPHSPGDARANPDRPATDDERVIAEKILGHCVHDEWTELTTRAGSIEISCRGCDQTFFYREPKLGERVDVRRFLLAQIVKPEEDDVVAQQVSRTTERAGWTVALRSGDGRWICTFSAMGRAFASRQHASRAAAICEAAAKVGRSGLFRTR
jgi:hypothetical protein